jgi:hypothetical protein
MYSSSEGLALAGRNELEALLVGPESGEFELGGM